MSKPSTSPSLTQTVRPVAVLVLICMVAGLLLGAVHELTAPIAQANEERKAQEVYASLVPEAASFEDVYDKIAGSDVAAQGCTAALVAQDSAGETIAHIIVAQSKGYGGPVPIAVAFGQDGTVRSITAMSNEETPGLGTKVADDSYIGQYVGLAAGSVTADDIDLISGATISSKAALAAFNTAVAAYEEVR